MLKSSLILFALLGSISFCVANDYRLEANGTFFGVTRQRGFKRVPVTVDDLRGLLVTPGRKQFLEDFLKLTQGVSSASRVGPSHSPDLFDFWYYLQTSR